MKGHTTLDRIMYDSDQPAAIPASAPIAATYSDLVPDLAALTALRNRWTGRPLILIDRGMGDPTGQSSAIDVETGAYSPAGIPAWWDHQNAAGIPWLTIYCTRDGMAAAHAAAGDRLAWLWVATLDGTCHVTVPAGARLAGIQVLGAAQLGRHADLSIITDAAWQPAAAVDRLRAELADVHNIVGQLNRTAEQLDTIYHHLEFRAGEVA